MVLVYNLGCILYENGRSGKNWSTDRIGPPIASIRRDAAPDGRRLDRVNEEHCGRPSGATERLVVAHVSPQRSSSALHLGKHRHRRVIAMDALGSEHISLDQPVSLPAAGYDYDIDWTPMSAGLAPAGIAASFAALGRITRPAISRSTRQSAGRVTRRSHLSQTRRARIAIGSVGLDFNMNRPIIPAFVGAANPPAPGSEVIRTEMWQMCAT